MSKKDLFTDTEAELAKRIRHGESALFSELLRSCQPTIQLVAKEFARMKGAPVHFPDEDELVQIGTILLWKRIVPGYKEHKKARFLTYMCFALRNAFKDEVKSAGRPKRNMPPLKDVVANRRLLGVPALIECMTPETIACEKDGMEASSARIEALSRILRMHLSKYERKALELRYGLFGVGARPVKEVAKKLGIGRSTVRVTIWRALRKLKALSDTFTQDQKESALAAR